jgi:hypothetical protein
MRPLEHLLCWCFARSLSSGSALFASAFDQICVPLAGEPVIENAPVEGLRYGVFADHTIVATAKSPILNRHENRTYQV